MKSRGASHDLAQQPPPKVRKRPGRVPVSCAECRRLKLRCDRNQPCENCSKRGCGAICPDGSLTTGRGNRLVLTSTAELHDKVDTLCARVRELEDALRTLQASVSSQPHPLLINDSSRPLPAKSYSPPHTQSPVTNPTHLHPQPPIPTQNPHYSYSQSHDQTHNQHQSPSPSPSPSQVYLASSAVSQVRMKEDSVYDQMGPPPDSLYELDATWHGLMEQLGF